jgi:hypothetical protein
MKTAMLVFWKSRQCVPPITNSVAPEPEGSSPHSQQPANDTYLEPGESTQHPPTNLPKVHFDPILPSTPRSFEWSFSFGLSHQNPVHVSPLSHACHMPRPPHSPWFDLPNDIRWWVQIMKLPIVQLSPFFRYFILVRSSVPPMLWCFLACLHGGAARKGNVDTNLPNDCKFRRGQLVSTFHIPKVSVSVFGQETVHPSWDIFVVFLGIR